MDRTFVHLLAAAFSTLIWSGLHAQDSASLNPPLAIPAQVQADRVPEPANRKAALRPVLYRPERDIFTLKNPIYRPDVDKPKIRYPIYYPEIDRFETYRLTYQPNAAANTENSTDQKPKPIATTSNILGDRLRKETQDYAVSRSSGAKGEMPGAYPKSVLYSYRSLRRGFADSVHRCSRPVRIREGRQEIIRQLE